MTTFLFYEDMINFNLIADYGSIGLNICGIEWCIKKAKTDVPNKDGNSENSKYLISLVYYIPFSKSMIVEPINIIMIVKYLNNATKV